MTRRDPAKIADPVPSLVEATGDIYDVHRCRWLLCCRRAGRRERQVPSGHRRTGLDVHRTHRLLRSVRVECQSPCSSRVALCTSTRPPALHIPLSALIVKNSAPLYVRCRQKRPLSSPGYVAVAYDFHCLCECHSAVIRQAFVHR